MKWRLATHCPRFDPCVNEMRAPGRRVARGEEADGHNRRGWGEGVGRRLGEEVVGCVLGAEEGEDGEGRGLVE